MYNLIRFFVKYHLFFVFLLLEAVSVFLMASTSGFRQSVLMAKVDAVKGRVGVYTGRVTDYFALRPENEALAEENARLRSRLELLQPASKDSLQPDIATSLFVYTPATVVENSLNKRDNYLILNVGKNNGVIKDMGVISPKGIVGTVDRVSGNFCTVMSLLNTTRNIDAKLKKTGHHGPLVWDAEDIRHIDLINIPQHISIAPGDTVVTSGYSMTFPEGIFIGTISSFEIEKGTNYKISVKLANDFQTLQHVYVINSLRKPELDSLKAPGN